MRHHPSSFKKLESKNLQQILSSQLKQCNGMHKRTCDGLPDTLFLEACLKRVITLNQSGRDFLQTLHEVDDQKIPRSTFFDALHSNRRLLTVKEMSYLYHDFLSDQLAGVDYLQDFPEMDDYHVFSADGHFIEHPSHLAKKCGKKIYAPGNLFIQNIRNGLIQLFTPVTDGSAKAHELPHFKKTIEKINSRQKIIWVADRAYMDNRWWGKQKKKRNYIISRAKSNRSVIYCGDNRFDREDPVNDGVLRDSFGGFTNTASPFRIVDYIDPETGEAITFYTTLSKKIRPGVICWLYFLRWKIEKAFDCFKNALGERKAWAVGLNALQIQGCSICMVYNFIQFLSEKIQAEYQCMDKKAEKKYQENLAKRLSKARSKGMSIHPLLLFSRFISRISSQFIRVVRNHFSSKKLLRLIIPLFIQRLEAYL